MLKYFSFFFPRKQDLIFHENCLHWRQYSGYNKKNTTKLSPEFIANRVVKGDEIDCAS